MGRWYLQSFLCLTIEFHYFNDSKCFQVCVLEPRDGKDFLFLFDLLAHTCGLESTLRVLTHSGKTSAVFVMDFDKQITMVFSHFCPLSKQI